MVVYPIIYRLVLSPSRFEKSRSQQRHSQDALSTLRKVQREDPGNKLYLSLWNTTQSMQVKNDHCSKFSNLSNWKEEAWKNQGFKGIPLKSWFFQASSLLLLKLENNCDDYSSLFIYHRSSHMNYFIYTSRHNTMSQCQGSKPRPLAVRANYEVTADPRWSRSGRIYVGR